MFTPLTIIKLNDYSTMVTEQTVIEINMFVHGLNNSQFQSFSFQLKLNKQFNKFLKSVNGKTKELIKS